MVHAGPGSDMRYRRSSDILRLATLLQGSPHGMTIDDIAAEMRVSRRTAERMRDAVDAAFGPLLAVDTCERRVHWRLRSRSLRGLVRVSAEEAAELESAARRLERSGLAERAETLRELAVKLRALRSPPDERAFDGELEALMRAEGLAMRAGPRQAFEPGLLALFRDAIKARVKVEFDYVSRSTRLGSRQLVEPHGVIYGNRAYLVGRSDWSEESRLWSLSNVKNAHSTGQPFNLDPDFDLREYTERSFGVFQEPAVDVELRFDAVAALDAANFLFHPNQTLVENGDGSLTVRFRAGGLDEMCWHLVTWGTSVTVERPAQLRERLRGMCAELARHHADPDAVGGSPTASR